MPSRRDLIKLSDDEQRELLEAARVAIITTNGPKGWPHAMPMWYLPRDGEIWIWTYGKSQKVRNLERDPKATLLIETGGEYHELRGVMIEAEAVIHSDQDTILGFGKELTARYSGGLAGGDGEAVLQAQAAKRVALQFVPKRTASWDHRKLAGTY
jgi:PPOX class probable F420-dependent enzyme